MGEGEGRGGGREGRERGGEEEGRGGEGREGKDKDREGKEWHMISDNSRVAECHVSELHLFQSLPQVLW